KPNRNDCVHYSMSPVHRGSFPVVNDEASRAIRLSARPFGLSVEAPVGLRTRNARNLRAHSRRAPWRLSFVNRGMPRHNSCRTERETPLSAAKRLRVYRA